MKYLGLNIHRHGNEDEDMEINNKIENETMLYYTQSRTFIRRNNQENKDKRLIECTNQS